MKESVGARGQYVAGFDSGFGVRNAIRKQVDAVASAEILGIRIASGVVDITQVRDSAPIVAPIDGRVHNVADIVIFAPDDLSITCTGSIQFVDDTVLIFECHIERCGKIFQSRFVHFSGHGYGYFLFLRTLVFFILSEGAQPDFNGGSVGSDTLINTRNR